MADDINGAHQSQKQTIARAHITIGLQFHMKDVSCLCEYTTQLEALLLPICKPSGYSYQATKAINVILVWVLLGNM